MDTLFRDPVLHGPFLGSHALSERWLVRKQLFSPLFKRLFHNVYLPAAIPVTYALRCEAAALVAPEAAVLTGLSAAAICGFDFAAVGDPVEFIVPEPVRFSHKRGMDIRRTTISGLDSRSWNGIRLASPLRMAMDILTHTRLRKSLPRVVGYLDALLRADVVKLRSLSSLVLARHDHGIVRARQAVDLADPRAESIPESEMRVWLRLAGLEPDVQVTCYDDFGLFLGRLDLAFLRYKIAVEYDGEWHGDGDQPRLDAERRARFIAAGWRFVVVDKALLYGDPQAMVAVVREEIRRRISGS